MKLSLLFFLSVLAVIPASAQIISAIMPARLQVFGMNADGTQVTATSDQLMVLYDNLNMSGELKIGSLQTTDIILLDLIESAVSDKITFSGKIPEGKFIYRDSLKEQFSVETELVFGDFTSQILLNFEISNLKTSLSNTFAITVTGNLSLVNDLGRITRTNLDDRISFLFMQNVQAKTY